MIANPKNKNSYSEPFDLERLEQIASDVLAGRGTNGDYSDLECQVYSLFMKVFNEGRDCGYFVSLKTILGEIKED